RGRAAYALVGNEEGFRKRRSRARARDPEHREETSMATKRVGNVQWERPVEPRSVRATDSGPAQRAIRGAITASEIIWVGVLNLVRTTLVTALSGARDVGGEAGATALGAVRGAVKAAFVIGGDLGVVAKHAIKGTVQAAEEIGEDLGRVVKAGAKGAVRAAGGGGGDVAGGAKEAGGGTNEGARGPRAGGRGRAP